MTQSTHPDTYSRADLLTYLVVSQLMRHRLTGKWLTAEHAVESTQLWMYVNGRIDLLVRVSLATQAQCLATQMLSVSKLELDARALVGAFAKSGNLDYRSPAVAEVRHTCMAHMTSRSTLRRSTRCGVVWNMGNLVTQAVY
ncbi:hypothetical protein [Paraburkholderia dipogonis]|uniref:hypothetical protein n=1 Tax=Paraburkholderia dipogonis TaxID=1211383 RepID=UPI001AD82FEA|nr:hypothetical protein [Paraburkholderia dipogonis]